MRGHAVVLSAFLLCSPVLAQEVAREGAAGEAEPSDGTLRLAPIIVGGELLQTPLGEVTSSVSVFTADDLEERGIDTFDRATRGVPNLGPPTTLGPPAIRGLSSSGPGGDGGGGLATNINTGSLPRAPFVIDGVARIPSFGDTSFRDLWDVESLEIFRGPQTTLRGRNAIAGAFVIETKDPTFEPEAAVRFATELDAFHGPAFRSSAAVSGPVVEEAVAVRIAVDREDGKIPIDLVGPRTSLNPDAKLTEDDQLDSEVTRLRAKALILPPALENLTANLLFDGQIGTVPGNRFTVGDRPLSGEPVRNRAYPFGRGGGQRVYDTHAWTTALDTDFEFRNGMVVRSITSFTQDRLDTNDRQSDSLFFDIDERQFNQDLLLKLGGEDTWLGGVAGLSFNRRWQDVEVENVALPLADQTFTASDEDSWSQAAFADLRVGIAEDLDLLLGARLNRYHAERKQESFTGSPGGPLPPPGTLSNDLTEVRFLPKIGLSWGFAPSQAVAVTARQGYNPGGASVVLSTGAPYEFDSESVWTFEGTYRGAFFDDRLSLGVTTFFNRFEDPQLYLQQGGGGLASLRIVNAERGQSYGAEIEALFHATDSLSFNAGLGLLETEITRAAASNPEFEGNDFGADPDATVSVGANWEPVKNLNLNAQASYVAEYFSDVTNESSERAGDYFLLDVGSSYTIGAVTGRLFVKNLTDEIAVTRKLSDCAGTSAICHDLLSPRTFGFELSARF